MSHPLASLANSLNDAAQLAHRIRKAGNIIEECQLRERAARFRKLDHFCSHCDCQLSQDEIDFIGKNDWEEQDEWQALNPANADRLECTKCMAAEAAHEAQSLFAAESGQALEALRDAQACGW